MASGTLTAGSVYDFEARDANGVAVRLDRYRGRPLLIVNVASQCGFTPQYAALEALYRQHRARGFVVLAFPCNQFGRQEPGSDAEIQQFCRQRYDVTFPVFARIEVNGPGAHPLFAFLKSQKRGLLGSSAIKWNFTKFLVDREGRVVSRFSPSATPESIGPDVAALLE